MEERKENVFLYISNEIVQSFIYNSPLVSQNEHVIYNIYVQCIQDLQWYARSAVNNNVSFDRV